MNTGSYDSIAGSVSGDSGDSDSNDTHSSIIGEFVASLNDVPTDSAATSDGTAVAYPTSSTTYPWICELGCDSRRHVRDLPTWRWYASTGDNRKYITAIRLITSVSRVISARIYCDRGASLEVPAVPVFEQGDLHTYVVTLYPHHLLPLHRCEIEFTGTHECAGVDTGVQFVSADIIDVPAQNSFAIARELEMYAQACARVIPRDITARSFDAAMFRFVADWPFADVSLHQHRRALHEKITLTNP